MTTLNTIREMMQKEFDLKPEVLTPDATLESLGLDSLSVIEFTFKVEEELNIKIPDVRVELKTFQDVVDLVDRAKSGFWLSKSKDIPLNASRVSELS